jgi:hypothetical protein
MTFLDIISLISELQIFKVKPKLLKGLPAVLLGSIVCNINVFQGDFIRESVSAAM